jgi:hypothetical protein
MTPVELFILKLIITFACSFVGVLVMIRSHNKKIRDADRKFELTLKYRGMNSEVKKEEI